MQGRRPSLSSSPTARRLLCADLRPPEDPSNLVFGPQEAPNRRACVHRVPCRAQWALLSAYRNHNISRVYEGPDQCQEDVVEQLSKGRPMVHMATSAAARGISIPILERASITVLLTLVKHLFAVCTKWRVLAEDGRRFIGEARRGDSAYFSSKLAYLVEQQQFLGRLPRK
jgi:hypothetical protein